MASWTVLEPPASIAGSFEAADHSAFVKDGWCWPALLIPPIWLVWRRMWLVLLGWSAVALMISLASSLLDLPAAPAAGLEVLFALWFALEANAMRRWTLIRNGWRFAGIATGADLVDAEHRHFHRRRLPRPPSRHGGAAPPLAPLAQRSASGEPIIGMFPEPWDARR